MLNITKRNIAKGTLTFTTYMVASEATDRVLTDKFDPTTEAEKTGTQAVSMLVGWYVSHKLRPFNHALVDRVADWRIARKADEAEHPAEA